VRRLRDDVEAQQVCDEQEASGPLAGIIAGMTQVDTPWIFAVACDMPFVKPGMVEQLAKYRFDSATQNHLQAVVPMIDGYQQPLAAYYSTNTLAVMRKSLATGDNSIRGALKNLTVRYVSEAELNESDPQMGSFFDLDTPDDLARAGSIKE
jgi:molybdopterin-guanine dinucleotide biosynthesis protein A